MKNLFKKFAKLFTLPYDLIFGPVRANLAASLRQINPVKSASWEFSCYSNSGEDGILDYLLSVCKSKNKKFIEIGSANGLSNNTAYLAIIKSFSGIMIEGGAYNCFLSKLLYRRLNRYDVKTINMFVTLKNIIEVVDNFGELCPDVLSIDIDGMDYHILKKLLEYGVAPKIIIVEYNSNYGPDLEVTIPYSDFFDYSKAHATRLYYGVSYKAWVNLLNLFGYELIDTDSSGVNAFFASRSFFDQDFLSNIDRVGFRDNIYEKANFSMSHEERFKDISNMPYFKI